MSHDLSLASALRKTMSLVSETAKSNLYTMEAVARSKPELSIPPVPAIPSQQVRTLRAKLILEEALETLLALGVTKLHVQVEQGILSPVQIEVGAHAPTLGFGGLEQIVDGCADLHYVTIGTLMACGVPDVEPCRRVQAANQAKFPNRTATLDPKTGKFLKPKDWVPPYHSPFIESWTIELEAGRVLGLDRLAELIVDTTQF